MSKERSKLSAPNTYLSSLSSAERAVTLPAGLDLTEGAARYVVDYLSAKYELPPNQIKRSRDILAACGAVREALAAGDQMRALDWAVTVGVLLQRSAEFRVSSDKAKAGGRTRGDAQRRASAARAQQLSRLIRRFDMSEELQDQYSTVIAYLARQTSQHPRTIRRHLAKLKRSM